MIAVIDANNLGSRGYFVHPFSFFNMVKDLYSDLKFEHIIFCFDSDVENFRRSIYPEYKRNREKNKERYVYLDKLLKSLRGADFTVLQDNEQGYEADDLCATVARNYSNSVVISGDKDLLSLVGEGVAVMWYGKHFGERKVFTEQDVEAKFGIPAKYFVEYKALVGDTSDGYPGVKGIGPKKAQEIIGQSFDIHNIDLELYTPAVRRALENTDLTACVNLARLYTVPKFKAMCTDRLLSMSTYSRSKLEMAVNILGEIL